jgi:hypothetical protein
LIIATFVIIIAYLSSQRNGKTNNNNSNTIERLNADITEKPNKKTETYLGTIKVITIDSCKYIIYSEHYRKPRGIYHKQNCKFCKKRELHTE